MIKEANRIPVSRQRHRGERGQSMLEFAIVLPIFVFLVLALMQVGDAMNSYLTVVAAARDAARLGAQGSATDAQIASVVDIETDRLRTNPTFTTTSLTNTTTGCTTTANSVCITRYTGTNGPSSTPAIRVRVCYDLPLIAKAPPLITTPIRLCSITTMRNAGG